jgi:hypothetical protein
VEAEVADMEAQVEVDTEVVAEEVDGPAAEAVD